MSSCQKTDKTNRISEYSSRNTSDETIFAVTDRETDAQLNEWRPVGDNGGAWGHRSGVPFLLQHFQLSPSTLVTIYEHDLPTLQLPHSALGANLSHPPTTSNQPPVHLWPSDPQRIPHLDKTNLMSHMQNYICIMYVLKQARTLARRIRSPVFTLRGQWLFFSTGSKVSNKKIQYSKCTGSPAYQYII